MNPRRPLALRRFVAGSLGAVGFGLLAWVGLHWTELVDVPFLWRRVRALQALRSERPDDPAFRPSLHYGLSPFDYALSRLIRLQRPGFLGGKGFYLVELSTREGERAFTASFEALEVPFDEEPDPPDPEAVPGIVIFYCDVASRSFLLLDPRGQARGEVVPLLLKGSAALHSRVLPHPRGHDVLCVPAYCLGVRLPWDLEHELSADRSGLMPHGVVAAGGLQVAQAGPLEGKPVDLNPLEVLLDSPHEGDLHRALALLESSGASGVHRIEPLLDHPDPSLRAHAAAVLALDPALARLAVPLLADPSPRVRHAALQAVQGAEGWEAAVLTLRADPQEEIRWGAHWSLSRSGDDALAGASALHLYRERAPWAATLDTRRCAELEVAEALLAWLEDLPDDDSDFAHLAFNLHHGFAADVLRPLYARVLTLHDASQEMESWSRRDLAMALLKADRSRAEEALFSSWHPEDLVALCEEVEREEER